MVKPDDCQHLLAIDCLHGQLSGHVVNKTYNVQNRQNGNLRTVPTNTEVFLCGL